MFRTMLTTWTRRDRWQAAGLLGFIVLMHAVAFGILFGIVGPAHYQFGTKVIVGLFVLTGVVALTYWRTAKVEDRWTRPAPADPETA